jgi:hypothetical protein
MMGHRAFVKQLRATLCEELPQSAIAPALILPPSGGGYRWGVKGAIPPPIPTFPRQGGRDRNSGWDRSSKRQNLWVKFSPEGEGV